VEKESWGKVYRESGRNYSYYFSIDSVNVRGTGHSGNIGDVWEKYGGCYGRVICKYVFYAFDKRNAFHLYCRSVQG